MYELQLFLYKRKYNEKDNQQKIKELGGKKRNEFRNEASHKECNLAKKKELSA